MDWSEERYVRLFTRDTVDWEMLPWQARALWPNLLRKVDRAGLLPLGRHGAKGLAALVKLPLEVVEVGLAGLLEDGCLAAAGEVLLVPNFLEAQEAPQSDRMRQSESRARRRDIAAAEAGGHVPPSKPPPIPDELSRNVTDRHETQQNVTSSHEPSHRVTPCRAVPSLAIPKNPPNPPAAPGGGMAGDGPPSAGVVRIEARRAASGRSRRQGRKPTAPSVREERLRPVADAILEATGVEYTDPRAWDRLRERLDEGGTVDDALAVVRAAVGDRDRHWLDRGLPPGGLFAGSVWARYLPIGRAMAGRRRAPELPLEEPPEIGMARVHQCRGCGSYHPATWDGARWMMLGHGDCTAPEARTA